MTAASVWCGTAQTIDDDVCAALVLRHVDENHKNVICLANQIRPQSSATQNIRIRVNYEACVCESGSVNMLLNVFITYTNLCEYCNNKQLNLSFL